MQSTGENPDTAVAFSYHPHPRTSSQPAGARVLTEPCGVVVGTEEGLEWERLTELRTKHLWPWHLVPFAHTHDCALGVPSAPAPLTSFPLAIAQRAASVELYHAAAAEVDRAG
jgi:hypothetical protein